MSNSNQQLLRAARRERESLRCRDSVRQITVTARIMQSLPRPLNSLIPRRPFVITRLFMCPSVPPFRIPGGRHPPSPISWETAWAHSDYRRFRCALHVAPGCLQLQ